MKAFITGMNGFVGTHLSEHLVQNNFELFGADKVSRPNSLAVQYEVDINDHEQMEKILADIRPEYLYHLAAPAFIPDSYERPVNTFRTILDATLNILEIIRRKSPYTKLLYVGSSEEYGTYIGTPFTEEQLPLPCTPYAAAKAAASLICGQYAAFYDVQVVRTRSFNHIGPGQSPQFVCSRIARQIAMIEKDSGARMEMGNLNSRRDFLDVRDVVRAYALIMRAEDNNGEVYNVCSGKSTAIQSVLDMFLDMTELRGRSGFEVVSTDQLRRFDNVEVCGNNSKLSEATGWEAEYPLSKTIKDTLKYWRDKV